jgi:G patch domain/KOW motif-containing protein
MGGSRQQHEQSRVRDDVQRQQQKQQQRGESSSATSSDEDDGCAGQGRQQQQQRRGRPTLAPHKLWVAPLTRVRIVDKRIQGGRLYLKKGCVLDVAPDGSCDVRLEEGRQVVTAHQDQLETVVPQEVGAAVMVVQGRHKGRKGRLLQVSLSSGAAALQLVGDLEVVRLLLDDVAQFMGHLEEEDH